MIEISFPAHTGSSEVGVLLVQATCDKGLSEVWAPLVQAMGGKRLSNSNTKINSKWIKDLNIRPDDIKFPEGNIGRMVFSINHRNILFDPPPRKMTIKKPINQWDLIKLRSSYTAKETIKK